MSEPSDTHVPLSLFGHVHPADDPAVVQVWSVYLSTAGEEEVAALVATSEAVREALTFPLVMARQLALAVADLEGPPISC